MEPRKNKNINKGAAVVSILFLLLFFVLIGRFGYIQMTKEVNDNSLMALAKQRWTTSEQLEGRRGTIYGSNGEVLAKDVPAFTLIAVLEEEQGEGRFVKDPQTTAEKLAPILDMEESKIFELLSKDAFQVQFGSAGDKLSYEKKEKIESLDLPGIRFDRETKRFYPKQTFASYVLGYTDFSGKVQKGMMGIEESFNEQLTGKDGSITYREDNYSIKLPDSNEQIDPPKNGNNIHLTIDHHIQTYLEQAMKKADEKYNPKRIIAIVADPKTGDILAMSNRPSFNPNMRNITNYTNQAVAAPYEPGSTIKIFTLAAAINEDAYPGHQQFQSGRYKIAGEVIHDHHAGGWGPITFNEGVRRSSNVGFSILAQKYLGFDSLYDYLQAFGFTEKTGIALPNEADSMVNFKSPVDKASTAFGQATAVTAIQQIQAATAIANDGKMMQPHVVKKIVNPNTKELIKEVKPEVIGTPITAETAKKVRELLGTVISAEDGTGNEYAIKGYDVAGKTGTAQISINGGYLDGEYIHSFLGMAPEKNPQLMMYVAVDRPELEEGPDGGKPASDIFTSVMKHSLQYLDIEPREETATNAEPSISIKDYRGQSVDSVQNTLKNQGLEVVVIGSGKTVKEQAPYPGSNVLAGERIVLRTSGTAKMPDMQGWSFADVMKLIDVLKLNGEIEGSGYVVSQGIVPGSAVKDGAKLKVKLSRTPSSQTQNNSDDDEGQANER